MYVCVLNKIDVLYNIVVFKNFEKIFLKFVFLAYSPSHTNSNEQ